MRSCHLFRVLCRLAFMAARTRVLEAFAQAVRRKPLAIELTFRTLAKAGLLPRGAPGKRSGHYGARSLRNIVLALAAPMPSDAAEAVKALEGLVCNTNQLAQHVVPGSSFTHVQRGVLFGEWLEGQIVARAHAGDEFSQDAADFSMPLYARWHLEMNMSPPWATHVRPCETAVHMDSFGPDKRSLFDEADATTLAHQTLMSMSVLNVAGRLLADTLAHEGASPIPPPTLPGVGEGDATPKKARAFGMPVHEGPRSDEPAREARAAPSDKAQSATDKNRKQSASDSVGHHARVCHPPNPWRYDHGSHRTHPAPA